MKTDTNSGRTCIINSGAGDIGVWNVMNATQRSCFFVYKCYFCWRPRAFFSLQLVQRVSPEDIFLMFPVFTLILRSSVCQADSAACFNSSSLYSCVSVCVYWSCMFFLLSVLAGSVRWVCLIFCVQIVFKTTIGC